jgi:hypothetical protein
MVDRRIAIEHGEVEAAVDAYKEQASLSPKQEAALLESLRDRVERVTVLTQEGMNALRPWSEVRPEIDQVHRTVVEELRAVFSETELKELAAEGLIVYGESRGTGRSVPPS